MKPSTLIQLLLAATLLALTAVDARGQTTRTYDYDALGNRTSATSLARFTSTAAFSFQPRRVLAGDRVNIYGRNFPAGQSGQMSITFGGVAGVILDVAPRVVSAEVPLGVVSGSVVITLPGGAQVDVGSLVVEGVTVTPEEIAVDFGDPAVQFTATVTGAMNMSVDWSVNGIPNGDASVGTITNDGLYTPPAAPVAFFPFLVTASNARLGISGAAVVNGLCASAPPTLVEEMFVAGVSSGVYQRNCFEFVGVPGQFAYIACIADSPLSTLLLRDSEGHVLAADQGSDELILPSIPLFERGVYSVEVVGGTAPPTNFQVWLDTHGALPNGVWLFPGVGEWAVASHWSNGVVPDVSTPVMIDVPNVVGEITVSGSQACASLTCAEDLTVTGQLTCPGNVTVQGAFSLAGTLVDATVSASSSAIQVTSSSTLRGVTLDGDVQVANFLDLHIQNGLTLNSTMTLGGTSWARLRYNGTQSLDGTGTVQMASGSAGILHQSGTLTIEPSIVVEGYGYVGTSASSWINRGTIRSTSSSGFSVNGNGWVNHGLIESTPAGGTLTVNGTGWSNEATIQGASGNNVTLSGTGWTNAATGTIALSDATATLNGTYSQLGLFTATNSVVNLGGSFVLSDLGTFVVTGGPVNQTGTLTNDAPGGLDLGFLGVEWRLAGGTIVGGSVNGAGPLLVTSSSTLNGVTLDTDVQVANFIDLNFQNGLTLNSTMTLGGTSWARLRYNGTQSLDGPGTVQMSSASAGILHQTGTLTIEPSIVVQGHGYVGNVNSSWINKGTIRSNMAGGFSVSGTGWVNQGLIESTPAGDTLTVAGTGWSNEATIQGASGKNVSLSGTGWTNAATGTVSVADATATLGGTYTQAGTFTATNSVVNLGGSFVLSDLGTFTVTGGPVNQTGTLTNSRAGGLDLGFLGVEWRLAGGTIVGGSVNGAGPLMVTASSTLDGVTLDTDVQVANFIDLYFQNGLTLNSTITLGGTSWGRLRYNGTQSLDGPGTVQMSSASAGILHQAGTLTIEPSIVVQGQGYVGNVNSSWINKGTIRSNTPGGFGVSGNGWVNQGLIESTVAGDTLTVGGTGWSNEATIQGASGKNVSLSGTGWTNAATGTIAVSDATATLGGTYTQSGTFTATNSVVNLGGSFVLSDLGTFTVTGGPVNQTGTLTNSRAGGLDLGFLGVEWRLAGGTIVGGSVNGAGPLMVTASSTLDGVTLDTDVQVANFIDLYIVNGLTLNSTITLGGTSWGRLRYNGTQSLDGTGTVQMSSTSAGILHQAGTLTIEPSIAVEGFGYVGNANSSWINKGTIRSNTAGGFSVSGNGWVNQGLIESTAAGGTLTLGGAGWSNEATIQGASGKNVSLSGTGWTNAPAGTVTVTDATATLGGTYTQAGTFTATNSVVNLGGSFVLSGLGTFSVTGGPVNQTGTLTNSRPGGLDLGFLGVEWRLAGGTIVGGSVNGTGPLIVTASSTLDGVTLDTDVQVLNFIDLYIVNGLTLNSTLTLGDTSWGRLRYNGTQSLDGTGTVLMSHSSTGILHQSGTLTIEPSIVVAGSGYVGNASSSWINKGTIRSNTAGGFSVSGNGWVNQGLIESTAAGGTLTVSGTGWSNEATIQGASGKNVTLSGTGWTNAVMGTVAVLDATATLNGTFTQAETFTATNCVVNLGGSFVLSDLGALTVTGGPVNLTGTLTNSEPGGLDAGLLGVDWRLAGGTIVGGSVNGTGPLMVTSSSTLDGVTLDTDVQLANFIDLYMVNGLTLNSTLTLGDTSWGRLRYNGTQSLDGTGTVLMAHSSTGILHQSGTLTIGPSILVEGHGYVGNGASSWINDGTIRCNGSSNLTLDGTWSNAGLVEATSTGDIVWTGTGSNDGTIALGPGAQVTGSAGFVQTSTGTLRVEIEGTAVGQFGRVSVTGTASIDGEIEATAVNGFVPTGGDMFGAVSGSSLSGTFSLENCTNFSCTLDYSSGTSAVVQAL